MSKIPAPFAPGTRIYLPEFPYLLPARSHPLTEDIRAESDAWVRESMGFALDGSREMALLLEETASLWTCHVLPTARDDRLRLLCKYTEYLSVFDNAMVDRTKIGKDPEAAKELFTRIAGILSDQAEGADFAWGSVLQGLWKEMCADTSPELWSRFMTEVHKFLSGCVSEITSRSDDRVFDYETYLTVRRDSVGMGMYFVLGEYGLGIDLTDDLTAHQELRDIIDTALVHIMLTNDLFSFRAEAMMDDYVNALAVLHLSEGLELQEATDRLFALIDGKRADFMAARAAIEASELGARPDIRAYLDALWHMMAGNLQWSYLTSRYNGSGHRWNGVRSGVMTLHADRTEFSDRGYWTLRSPAEQDRPSALPAAVGT
ncbi:terpene synthase family protein [Streptomyces sp. NPDC002055]|uniref:terpene synthase family protein n=1 Tax=Streptomyces sp. NPDC002055 TaxID=3154534 RepID=UPI0033253E1D